MWEIYKFGGTSITKNGFNLIKQIIENRSNKIVIVLSAVSQVTNILYQLSEKYDKNIFEQLKKKHQDLMNQLKLNNQVIILNKLNDLKKLLVSKKYETEEIVSYGEILSTLILHHYLKQDTHLIDSKKVIKQNENTFKGILDNFQTEVLTHEVIIMQGFIASDLNNKTCLLTRGGSDTTATLIGNMLDSKRVYIYKDVDGIYTTDPNVISDAEIITNLDYQMAQELSAMGAKVLHPYSIKPAEEKGIEIHIKNTYNSTNPGTIISSTPSEKIAVINQKDINTFHIKSLNMWNNYGFVHDIFKDFSDLGVDVNIITTSQFVVSCTTDNNDIKKLMELYNKLSKRYEVKLFQKSNMISVVGNKIALNNNFMEKLFLVAKNYKVHITHFSSNHLSISFIVENNDALPFNRDIHDIVVYNYDKWWKTCTNYFITNMKNLDKSSIYFYNLKTIGHKCELLKNNLCKVDQVFYAMKANSNHEVLQEITSRGIGLECVSQMEIVIALQYTDKILFTPNFCEIKEYQYAFQHGVTVIVDNINILKNRIFKNQKYGIRLDPIKGDGHHKKVITSGDDCKFGISLSDLDLLDKNNVIGLHCHKGSGITNPKLWNENGEFLLKYASEFPNLEWIDLGGGIGVNIDLQEINQELKLDLHGLKLYIEPGRYIVSTAGVLVSKVTQIKTKGNINYIGISTGMNSLIRPTLYNSRHEIHNISASYDREKKEYTIVGPICETGDILGENRILPETNNEDYILIENGGAYGYTMSSNYNLRPPADEFIIKYE